MRNVIYMGLEPEQAQKIHSLEKESELSPTPIGPLPDAETMRQLYSEGKLPPGVYPPLRVEDREESIEDFSKIIADRYSVDFPSGRR